MSLRTDRLVLVPFVVGPFSTNCYLLACARTGSAAIIDPGTDSPEELRAVLAEAERRGLDVELILNTHGHPDHIAGNHRLKAETGAEVLMHKSDVGLARRLLWKLIWPRLKVVEPDGFLEEGDTVRVGELELAVLHTPGHTPGSVCFYVREEGVLFSGDTLFAGSIGRTDLPESSHRDMMASLARLMELPDGVRVYPGHGPPTTIGRERHENLFVRMALRARGHGQP